MRIKQIAALCKRSKRITLCNDRDESLGSIQWLGDSASLYAMYAMPFMEEDNVFAVFDITERQRGNMVFSIVPPPEGGLLADDFPGERILAPCSFSIVMDEEIQGLKTFDGRVLFIKARHLAPLADIAEELELRERRMPDGKSYVAAKLGMVLYALIIPCNAISEAFAMEIEAVAAGIQRALAEKEALAGEEAQAGEKAQTGKESAGGKRKRVS